MIIIKKKLIQQQQGYKQKTLFKINSCNCNNWNIQVLIKF